MVRGAWCVVRGEPWVAAGRAHLACRVMVASEVLAAAIPDEAERLAVVGGKLQHLEHARLEPAHRRVGPG